MSIFKSNDIRGIYPDELNGEIVEKIGFCLPELLGARKVVVGRDCRKSSDILFQSLCSGIGKAGADVIDIGYCDTPALYFAAARYGFKGSVMISASHNPPEYNGLKISGEHAVPIGRKDGLDHVEELIRGGLTIPHGKKGTVEKLGIGDDYISHLLTFAGKIENRKVVVDCSEGAAGYFIKDLVEHLPGEYHLLYDTPDGNFPNRDPDPLKLRGRDTIVRKIIETGSDLGVCFDGDADRAIFFDENGEFISPDMITALLGNYFLDSGIGTSERSDGDTVFYDIRSSNSVKEYIGRHGGKSVACRTGHSHIKKLMREGKGIFAGELSGHYYFRDNYNCDSGFIAFLSVLSVLSMQKRSFKEIVESVNPYYFSGEINFLIDDLDPILRKIKTRYSDGKVTEIDGIRLDFDNWWFILRFSTAEPVLRLVVEATSSQGMAAKIAELSGIILSENGRRI